MDFWVSRHWQRAYDENGMLAAKGQVDEKLLECMLQHEYFSRPSPKSTGRDLFNEAWLSAQLSGIAALPDSSAALPVCGQEQQRLLDVLATLLALTAHSIALHLKQASFSVTQVRTMSRINLPRDCSTFFLFQPPICELLLYFVLFDATRVLILIPGHRVRGRRAQCVTHAAAATSLPLPSHVLTPCFPSLFLFET